MKKFFGILFLLVIAAICICAYFFPGLPYYYKCRHDFITTESIWQDIPKDLPSLKEGYDTYSTHGIRITAWENMEPVRTDEKNSVMWGNKDTNLFVSVYTDTLGENYDFLDMTGIDHKDLEAYCKEMHKTPPENKCEFLRLAAMLTMDDFDVHSMKNAKTFYKIMSCKNEIISESSNTVRFYPVDGIGYRGFLLTTDTPEGQVSAINIYPENDKHHRYIIATSVTDWNEVIAIAESIQLTEK